MTFTPEALEARAKREEDTYGQKELPAMLRAGAEAMRECERLRAVLADIIMANTLSSIRGSGQDYMARLALAALQEKPHD